MKKLADAALASVALGASAGSVFARGDDRPVVAVAEFTNQSGCRLVARRRWLGTVRDAFQRIVVQRRF